MTVQSLISKCLCRCACQVYSRKLVNGICPECKYRCPNAMRTGRLDAISDLVAFAEKDPRAETPKGWVLKIKEMFEDVQKP
jgi:hypothetical protein